MFQKMKKQVLKIHDLVSFMFSLDCASSWCKSWPHLVADGQKVPFAGSLGAVKWNVRTTDTLDGLEKKIVETRPCCEVLSDIIAEFEGSLKFL